MNGYADICDIILCDQVRQVIETEEYTMQITCQARVRESSIKQNFSIANTDLLKQI